MAASDFLTPGWQATLDSCPHQRTSGRSASGTNNRPAGHSTGTSTPRPASSTLCSMPQERAPTITPSESMASAGVSSPGCLNWRERVSGLTFLEPGRYERVNSNRSKKSAQRAWRKLSLLAKRIYYSSYDPSRPRKVVLTPPTNDATQPRPT